MQLGIIGLPQVGKTTIFELLTESRVKESAAGKINSGMARIPDHRIDFLSSLYKPKKTTYAQLEVIDIPGLIPGSEKAAANFLDFVRKADALLLVVRAFIDDSIPSVIEEINPRKEIDAIYYELIMADLDLVEKRIDRINSNKKRHQMLNELEVLHKLKIDLEDGRNINMTKLSEKEREIISGYQFLTNKPLFICVNLAEDQIGSADYTGRHNLIEYTEQMGIPLAEISANIEMEIAQLGDEDKLLFMENLNIEEAGIIKIARSMYRLLGLISFFTVGDDEVKAWTILNGTNARKAAGKIHSDIERGFIRAEVFAYDDFAKFHSVSALKEKGLIRLEGKEYLVKDGDVIHFRFNV